MKPVPPESKVAIVTGAARGIGLAVSRKFLEQGYRVALLDIDAAALLNAAAGLGAPDKVLAIECDVALPQQVKAAIDRAAAHFGRIDALVNNAGVAVFKPMLETTYEEWSRWSTLPRFRACARARCASPTAPARRRSYT